MGKTMKTHAVQIDFFRETRVQLGLSIDCPLVPPDYGQSLEVYTAELAALYTASAQQYADDLNVILESYEENQP